MPGAPVERGRGEGGEEVECEVVGSVEQIDRAVALIKESISQSQLSRRRQHSREKMRKPMVSESGKVRGHHGYRWKVINIVSIVANCRIQQLYTVSSHCQYG